MAGKPEGQGLRLHRRSLALALILGWLACGPRFSGAAPAEPALRIRNDSSKAWSLLMYSETGKTWLPPTFLPRRQAVKVDLSNAGRFYLVLRDDGDRDSHLGWRDLHAVAQRLAGPPDGMAELALSTRLVSEQREQTYTVQVPVSETRTRTLLVDGVEKQEEYVVTRMVPETRTRTVTVSEEMAVFTRLRDGQPVDLDMGDGGVEAPVPPPPGKRKAASPAP